ncbi:IDEAL domain-containing protein [Bacillus sp. PS06]|uniref:IDEAL domain-containing protein n=1 Tax=Bacillus sp. PS06 TaxID=2764176 RepID=UPI001CD85B70|nr:IDEAL domain-containing protein [Bacillus sp. PS06]
MSHLNNQKNELIPLAAISNETAMYQKEVEMVLLKSQISFQKQQLLEKIDNSLLNHDKQLFLDLSSQYNQLLDKYSHLI